MPNALNTISFAAPPTSGTNSSSNATTPAAAYEIETNALNITLNDARGYAVAVSEVQIWVPPQLGPRWEAEDGVIGTFIGSFEGRATGLNGSVVDGGVALGDGGWVELGGVLRAPDGSAGNATLTVIGARTGTLVVGVNWLRNYTVEFSGEANKTLEVEMLLGKNVVTLFQVSGTPWVDAIVVQ